MNLEPERNLDDFKEMIMASLDGSLDDAGQKRLEAILRQDDRALTYYREFIFLSSCLRQQRGIPWEQPTAEPLFATSAPDDTVLSQIVEDDLARQEKNNPPRPPVPAPGHALSARRRPTRRQVLRALVQVAAVVLVCLGILFVDHRVYQSQLEVKTTVAILTDQQHCHWRGKSSYQTGYTFRPGDLVLQSGLVELTFKEGARVIIEGPASFTLETAGQMFLREGCASAYVPRHAIGFAIGTPAMTVIDHGTRFGVKVDPKGTGELHMFEGQASLIAGRRGQTRAAEMLTAGSARRVNSDTNLVETIDQDASAFVQEFDSASGRVWHSLSLNLASLVGGGNGFDTGVLNRGVSPLDGKYHDFNEITTTQTGPESFQPVPDNAGIDGLFVPNGARGAVRISSTGLVFENCPVTNGGFWSGVFNGAWHGSNSYGIARHNLRLNGVAYGTPDSPAIYMHANQGITFDLQAIARRQPGLGAVGFRAVCGISETLFDYPQLATAWLQGPPNASFYVLADGKRLFAGEDLPPGQSRTINLALPADARFLTLITTQGSDGTHNHDWTLFGRPELILNKAVNE